MRYSKFSNFVQKSITSSVLLAMATAASAESFVAEEIHFSGLKRVTSESLKVALPISEGQKVSDEALADSIKALYDTEQFSNIQADVQGEKLTFYVTERPVIAELKFEGNKLIPKDGLEQGLKSTGLAVGNVLKQSTIQALESELENQYISQGYYNSDIEVKQTELDGNRVKLELKFVEGKPAKVVDINIIGNQHFSSKSLKEELALKDKTINPLSKANRYTQEKLNASVENIKAKYLNAGFVRVDIEQATLNIDEAKQKVFIEVSINEGEQYKFGKIQFLGNPTYKTEDLQAMVKFKQGAIYSQKDLDQTTNDIIGKFGDDGYYYAQIRPISRIDDQTHTVDIDYYIDPVRPVYVRRINFTGNLKTKDEVLRREMRQLEGALASNQKIQLSRVRLMRTGFFKDVKVDVRPVPNSPDQVDVNYMVEEQPSGSSTIAAGYSQSGGITFQADLSQSNFMGTGNKVTASFSRSETRDSYSLGLTDPFFTINGVSQSLNAYYRKTKYDNSNISNYVLDSYGASLVYGYPINEHQRLSGGFTLDSTKVRGGPYMGIANIKQLLEDGGTVNANTSDASFSKKYMTYGGILGWSYSSLDKPVFPTKGMSHNLDLTLGFGDQTYQKAVYRGNIYFPMWKGTVLRGWTKLGYGHNLPFYENFYAGGYGSVRGYEASTLGPQSQGYIYLANGRRTARGEEIGGNAMVTGGLELILPVPFKGDWANQVRPVLFVDAGQVYDTSKLDKQTVDILGLTNVSDLTYIQQDKEIRYSAGVGVTWYTPIGPISLSYAQPLNDKVGDETEKVQFQIGSVF